MSIKKFIFIGILVCSTIAFTLIFLLNKEKTSEEIEEVYDAQLAQTSRILQSFLVHPKDEINFTHLTQALATAERTYNTIQPTDEGHPYELKFGIQIWDSERKLLTKSPGMTKAPLSPFKDGYSTIAMQAVPWNVFAHQMENYGYWIMVAERGDVRAEMIDDITLTSFIGPALGIVTFICLIFVVVHHGLKPLTKLSKQLYERHINKLTPLDVSATPQELSPLITAINSLMKKVEDQVERERQFLGDIAHELRTPLTTIKLQAQGALKSDTLPEAHQALAKIVRRVDGSTHLITQLLTLARLDVKALGTPVVINFKDIIEQLLAQYRDAEQSVSVTHSPVLMGIYGHPLLIEVMVRNLLENAIKFTPAEKAILIHLQDDNDSITLSVTDEGEGVSAEKISSLGQRFFRHKAADQSGSGLGLSIVARIAALHDASLHFSHNTPSGLKVTVRFPKTKAT
jgi:two-component system, OmpR family, sensor histidine kinase QseC